MKKEPTMIARDLEKKLREHHLKELGVVADPSKPLILVTEGEVDRTAVTKALQSLQNAEVVVGGGLQGISLKQENLDKFTNSKDKPSPR